MAKITIEFSDDTYSDLASLVAAHLTNGAPNQQETIHDLLSYVAGMVADGYRRPGSWERGLVEQMGLIPNEAPPDSEIFNRVTEAVADINPEDFDDSD